MLDSDYIYMFECVCNMAPRDERHYSVLIPMDIYMVAFLLHFFSTKLYSTGTQRKEKKHKKSTKKEHC